VAKFATTPQRIVPDAPEDLRDEDLVPDEAVLISITARGISSAWQPRSIARRGGAARA